METLERAMLTFLNGRWKELVVLHNGKEVKIWDCRGSVPIEQSIINFCKENEIDFFEEINI